MTYHQNLSVTDCIFSSIFQIEVGDILVGDDSAGG